MKALDEIQYFLMEVFTLLLNRVHVVAEFVFNLGRELNPSHYEKNLVLDTKGDLTLASKVPTSTMNKYSGI